MARPSHSRFRVQHISRTPRGWRVRTKREGAHELRIAFPPGARRTGSGQLVEILHPIAERNPGCELAGKNPKDIATGRGKWHGYITFPEGIKYTQAVQSRQEAFKAAAEILDEKPDWRAAAKSYGAVKLAEEPNPAELVIFGNPSNPITDREIAQAHEAYLREMRKETDPKEHLSAATKKAWNRWMEMLDAQKSIYSDNAAKNPTWMNVGGVIGKLVDTRGDSPLTLEYRLEKKDGTKVWVKPRYGPRTTVKSTKKNAFGNRESYLQLLQKAMRWSDEKLDRELGPAFDRERVKQELKRMREIYKDRKNNQGEPQRGDDMQQSVSLYQTFHGKDPSGVIERQVSAEIRLDYASLGDLDYLIVKPEGVAEVKINFSGDGVKLASAPDGRQLYLIGGKQMLNEECLGKFTDDTSKDLFDLGEAREVQYIAKKAPNFDTVRYYHKFGEERSGSEMPRAFYDAIRRQIFLAGGEYHIEAPGIIN